MNLACTLSNTFSGSVGDPDSEPQSWAVRGAPRSFLVFLTRWLLERNLRGSTGLCGFCGFNKWNFETSKLTFDIQFIIFRFWNEGLGERSSSSCTYALSLQLDSRGYFAIFLPKNFTVKPGKFILNRDYSRMTKIEDRVLILQFAKVFDVWCARHMIKIIKYRMMIVFWMRLSVSNDLISRFGFLDEL